MQPCKSWVRVGQHMIFSEQLLIYIKIAGLTASTLLVLCACIYMSCLFAKKPSSPIALQTNSAFLKNVTLQ